MERFIGMDAHMQSCTFAVMGPTGRRLRQQVVETDAKTLRAWVQSVAGQKHLCMEEGTYSEWLYEVLEPLVCELVVVQPNKSTGNKDDAIDAWKLADDIRTGRCKPVYKAPGQFTALREAVRGHQVLQRDMVRAKLRLNAIFRSRGINGMGAAIYEQNQRQQWLEQLPPHHRKLAALLSSELDGLIEQSTAAELWLREEAKQLPIVKRLATAPGIGPIRAAQIVAIGVTPYRFRTSRQFWSYCGLAIVTRTSSQWTKDRTGHWVQAKHPLTRGLNRNRNPLLKNVFKGAAKTVTNLMPNHPLHDSYQRLVEAGTKPNLARLTLARRIAAAVLAMWKNNEDYDQAKQQHK